jgi:hypothetical protein
LADLSAFSFTDTDTVSSVGSGTYDYGLADLTAFSATISAGDVSALSLTTTSKPPTSVTGGFAAGFSQYFPGELLE